MRGLSVLNTPLTNCKKSPWKVCKLFFFFPRKQFIMPYIQSQVKRSSFIQHVALFVNLTHFTAFQISQHPQKILFCTFFHSPHTAQQNLHQACGPFLLSFPNQFLLKTVLPHSHFSYSSIIN